MFEWGRVILFRSRRLCEKINQLEKNSSSYTAVTAIRIILLPKVNIKFSMQILNIIHWVNNKLCKEMTDKSRSQNWHFTENYLLQIASAWKLICSWNLNKVRQVLEITKCIEQKKTNSDHSHNPPTNKHTHKNIPTCIHINTLSHPQTRNNEYVNVIDNTYIHQLPMKTDLNQKTTIVICTLYISEFLHYFQGGNSF